MKRIGSVLLLMAIVLQLSGTGLSILGYYLNKSYIASVLCEKKDVPQSHCEGKCQLKKQMKEDAEREANSPVQTLKSGIDWQLSDNNETVLKPHATATDTGFLKLIVSLIPGYPSSVFHPPGC